MWQLCYPADKIMARKLSAQLTETQENMTGRKRKMHLWTTSGKCSGHLSSAQELEKSHSPQAEGGQRSCHLPSFHS